MFGLAAEKLRRRCRDQGKEAHYALFERYDLDEEDISYDFEIMPPGGILGLMV